MRPINTTIIDIRVETPSVKSFILDIEFDFKPGQYVMVWVRGIDEIPMSISGSGMITVQNVGEATATLFKLNVGDTIGIRGPYGNGFDIHDPLLIVAGGVGAAPLAPLAKVAYDAGYDVTALIGARTKDELLFTLDFSDCGTVLVATDDGSAGHAGYVTDLIDEFRYRNIYTCGPEPMMTTLFRKLTDEERARSWFSLHRYIKCGLGVCGACCIDPCGHRMCVDGPVVCAADLVGSEFGEYKRGPDGSKVYI